ncbi:hypothetical protein [Paenibacillus sp. YYML68]|uniref:hypothetical protein n=1 Tax=Paenibacillus sp. YYML68 TaxID=2909250 RepID=UPI0024924AE9|nr:hypothetical protein [Paenibacillus sp. YYML68]
MSEKGILAYFHSREAAEGCVPKMQALRAADVQVSEIGVNPGEGVTETMNPLSNSGFPGLSYLSLGETVGNSDARVMMAADVDASGMADGSRELLTSGGDAMTSGTVLLTVVVDEAAYNQALRVIQEAGGQV